jgi:hypothetical protein
MSDSNQVIKEFTIQRRINETATQLTMRFADPLTPADYVTGSAFNFTLDDPTLPDGWIALTGVVESVNRDTKNYNKIYEISGRDKGRLLQRQPYKLDCTDSGSEGYTTIDILEDIFTDTGVTVGRGLTIDTTITFNTSGTGLNRFCGSWSSKEDAINQLFTQYTRLADLYKFRWWVDPNGNFRWLQTSTERAGKVYFFEDDENITDFKVKEDATNIVNDITGYYGDEEIGDSIHMDMPESIATYGLCVGEDLNNTDMNMEQMTEEVTRELNQKHEPIYTATVEISGFYDYDPGVQIEFPNDPYHSNKTFTVTDITQHGMPPGVYKTTLNLTTEESVISLPNLYDIIQGTAQSEANDIRARVGVVDSIPDLDSDRCNVNINGTVLNVRNVGGEWR